MEILLLIATLVLIVLFFAAIFAVLTRTTRKTRGGVEAPPRSQKRGSPPFEGVARDRHRDPAA